ncbi:MAG TPA: precorrin-8X methylmutase, partial [Devosia sp.]|nr:precorrin-8X methylmutase [Devosia sp.]
DTMMVAHGIIRARLPAANDVLCALDDPAARRFAREREHTRSAGGMHVLAPRLEGAVIAIGNAPTALFHLLELVAETGIRPALVVGMPVGFVGAAESKQALAHNDLDVAFITISGRRGGSAMAAAAINALAGAATR